MARKKGTFSYKRGDVSLDFYGFEDLLNKIVQAGGKLDDVIVRAIKASSKPIENDLLAFMRKHTKPVSKISTGATMESFTNVGDVQRTGGYVWYKLGFDIKEGGLPALFLDIGTPKITPSFFVYYAFSKNMDNAKREQEQALQEAFKELL